MEAVAFEKCHWVVIIECTYPPGINFLTSSLLFVDVALPLFCNQLGECNTWFLTEGSSLAVFLLSSSGYRILFIILYVTH